MKVVLAILGAAFVPIAPLTAQTTAGETPKITLSVPSGAPLRLYLTNRVSKRLGAPVEAKLLESVLPSTAKWFLPARSRKAR